MFTRFQALFVLGGIALIVVGLNSTAPLAIAGAVMIGLALLARWRGV